MLKIYHNPRCSKSRQGLEILNNSNQEFEVIKYLDNPLTTSELIELIEFLNISPIALVRKGEQIWKDNFKGKSLSDSQIIEAMAQNPKLVERPIVVKDNKAVIGRPPSLISDLI